MRTLIPILILAAAFSAAAQDNGAPQARPDDRRGEPRGFGGPIALNDDDTPAFPESRHGPDMKGAALPRNTCRPIGEARGHSAWPARDDRIRFENRRQETQNAGLHATRLR